MEEEFGEIVDVEAEEITEVGEEPARPAPGEVPVIAEVRAVQAPSSHSLPAVRAAAVAATGFMAGAAAAALVRRRGARRLSRAQAAERGDGLPVLSTHTYLIRVHVLGRPAE